MNKAILIFEGVEYKIWLGQDYKFGGSQPLNDGEADAWNLVHNDHSPFTSVYVKNDFNYVDYYVKPEYIKVG